MKKVIIWLSSYPKSGNTYVRIFLSHYIYSKKEKLDFALLNKISKFEHKETFSTAVNPPNFFVTDCVFRIAAILFFLLIYFSPLK